MRKWTKPQHMKDQERAMQASPEAFAGGGKFYVSSAPSHRVFLHVGSRPFPYVDLEVDGKRITLDSQELMNWLRYA